MQSSLIKLAIKMGFVVVVCTALIVVASVISGNKEREECTSSLERKMQMWLLRILRLVAKAHKQLKYRQSFSSFHCSSKAIDHFSTMLELFPLSTLRKVSVSKTLQRSPECKQMCDIVIECNQIKANLGILDQQSCRGEHREGELNRAKNRYTKDNQENSEAAHRVIGWDNWIEATLMLHQEAKKYGQSAISHSSLPRLQSSFSNSNSSVRVSAAPLPLSRDFHFPLPIVHEPEQ